MSVSYKRILLNEFNKVIGRVGFKLDRLGDDFQDYINLERTLSNAKDAGLSVGDYIDLTFNIPGSTQFTIDKMEEFGVFREEIERVCEIGPGSGRYLEKIIKICDPAYYEIYETAKDWRRWLKETYTVTAHVPNSNMLSFTPTNSIDLIHSHKVLYGNPIIEICRYFDEMIRVVRRNGTVVFDILTEDCLTDELLEKWWKSEAQHACSMTAKDFTINYFHKRGLSLVGNFTVPLLPGITEYFVFKK